MMKTPSLLAAFALVALPSARVVADHPAADSLGVKLGTVRFEVTGNDQARDHVVRGVKLLHHMMYVEADREFAAAVAADPACALAYWGRAMTIVHPLWPDVPEAAELKQGQHYVQAGLALPPKTARERGYLQVLATYFREASAGGHVAGLKAADEAWSRFAEQNPNDHDAAAFSALFHLAPARFLAKDKSNRIQLEASALLQKVLAQNPEHPGAQHYKIHAHDFPLLADRALEICDQYGAIAPDVPHALHMPTHIFTRRGLWDKSIEFNLRSAEAARKLAAADGSLNGHFPHAIDYLVYAYLQRGEYRKATEARDALLAVKGPFSTTQRTAMAFAFAAVPARCALERRDWAQAAQLPLRHPTSFPWSDQFLYSDSIVRFARAFGAVRSGQLEAAHRELEHLENIRRQLTARKSVAYWPAQAETQLLTTRAWLQLREGRNDEAVSLMRQATQLEATTDKEAVTPGEVLPAGELLGDMLFELNRDAEALAAYEAMLESSPNRLNGLYGAARAAERSGALTKAAKHYAQLLKTADAADAEAEPIQRAKMFLAAKPRQRAE